MWPTLSLALLLTLPTTWTTRGCKTACNLLDSLLPDKVFFPDTARYKSEQQYWSLQQGEVSPACRIAPSQATDVSTIVKTLRSTDCAFTIKGGGHTPFAGSSNVQDGITIDFEAMSSVTISPDSKTTAVGPGARWIQAYQSLDRKNLTVIGGRASDVGISGLTLGGGISYFSAQHGFACDNVDEYEVVLASGKIVTASPTQHADLYRALRGGGSSNFGIVTRFTLATYPQGHLWGGSKTYPISLNASLLHALTDYNTDNPSDRNAHLILPFAYVGPLHTWFAGVFSDYALPTPNPPIYHAFQSLPELSSTMRITNVSDLAIELTQGEDTGMRQFYRTFTIRNDPVVAQEMLRLCRALLSPLEAFAEIIACSFQPLPLNYLEAMRKNGGNSLGLEEGEAPLVIVNVGVSWRERRDDEQVGELVREFVRRGVRVAKEMGGWHRFIYMNYAGEDQEVQVGYGRQELERLRRVRDRYDPDGFWGRWGGYHKLP